MEKTAIIRRLSRPFLAFARCESGSVVAEGVIVLPLLIWSYIGLFVYWDAFREMNTVQKAGYTLSDVLSRERKGIQNSYITGMKELFDYLVGDPRDDNAMRVTSITRNGLTHKFEVHWSRTSNSSKLPSLTTSKLQDYVAQIPSMADSDYAIIVEVRVPYTPAFDVGLPDQVFSEFIVTRLRSLPCIAMDNVPCTGT